MPSDSVIHSLAGAAGGIIAMTATYPLIFLSTRAAVETKNEQKPTYQAIVDIIKREGVLGLYSGLSSSLLGVAVTNGAYYYFYERSRGMVLSARAGKRGGGMSTLESMLAGLIAGSATAIISNPIWVVQTTQAVRTMQGSASAAPPSSSSSSNDPSTSSSSRPRTVTIKKLGIVATIQHILRKDGLAAFFRGLGPALVLVMNPVIQYTVFEQLKNMLVRRRLTNLRGMGHAAKVATSVLTDWDYFILGALSKLIATSSTYPYIVVKSRLHAGQAEALRYKSAIDGIVTILREEGIQGLYKGVGSKLTQSVLTAAILFASQKRIYELTKQALNSVVVQ